MFSLVQANPTPFAGSTSPERLQQLKAQQAKTHSDAEEQAPSRPNSSKHLQETMMLASGPGQPAPLGPAFMRSASPGMSVDRYAAFVAEMQVKGASSDLLSRYGIPRRAPSSRCRRSRSEGSPPTRLRALDSRIARRTPSDS